MACRRRGAAVNLPHAQAAAAGRPARRAANRRRLARRIPACLDLVYCTANPPTPHPRFLRGKGGSLSPPLLRTDNPMREPP